MKKEDKKNNLEQDINQLADSLSTLVGEDRISELINKKHNDKIKLKELKVEYKEKNKYHRIKNLAIAKNVALFLVPLVIIPSFVGSVATGTFIAKAKIENQDLLNTSYVEEYVYLDNLGNEFVLEEDYYSKDFIRIESGYEKLENGAYVQNIYEYNHTMDSIEELEEKVNTNYLELLNELGEPSSKDTIIKGDIKVEDTVPKVSAIAKIYTETLEEEKNISEEELFSEKKKEAHKDGLTVACTSVLLMLVPWSIAFFKFQDDISEKYSFAKSRDDRKERIDTKRKIKKMKKEMKK